MDWMKITSAIFLVFMIVMIWPAARHHFKHGKKGSNKEWMNVAMLLGAVVGFVILLILMVKK